MNQVDDLYADLLASLLRGEEITTRNSKCRREVATHWTLTETPLVTLRRTAWKNALREMEWFLSGSSNIYDLHPAVKHWWAPWANDSTGQIRYNYSSQFRFACGQATEHVDQIATLVAGVKDHPFSRRNVVTTWNAADMASPHCPLTNCHGTVIQCFVGTDNKLDLVTYQRSADVVCGLPHNLIQYWAFLLWLAHRTGRGVGKMVWIGGDVHLYEAHASLAGEMVALPRIAGDCPQLVYTPTAEDFRADDFSLSGEYKPRIETRAEMII